MTVVKIQKDTKAKDTKKCAIKRKRNFENYKKCIEATQLGNKIKYLEKNEIKKDSLKDLKVKGIMFLQKKLRLL